jgi:16S rRNA (cytosine1402-N4)-methyltransferase
MTVHQPVLFEAVREAFTMPPGLVLDATAGGGGHTRLLLELGHRVIALDRDPAAIARLEGVFAREVAEGRLTLRNVSFAEASLDVALDGLLADLGLSSDQLADASRGFSFGAEGALDMRMDPSLPRSAAELVEEGEPGELARLFGEFGEERHAGRIARAVAGRRFDSAVDLARAIEAILPYGRSRIHPATRVFQALRIAVNDELGQLERLLKRAPDLINPGGRIAIISFHSLEDRLVKRVFRRWEGLCRCPPGLPICACGEKRIAFPLWKGARSADASEIDRNPRARSARIRAMRLIENFAQN